MKSYCYCYFPLFWVIQLLFPSSIPKKHLLAVSIRLTIDVNLIVSLSISFVVPARPPSNLRAQFLCSRYQLKISWTALPEIYRRGVLRSYKVLLYQGESLYKNVYVTSKEVTSVVSIDECRNYTIVLAALTTPGAGPNTTADAISSCSCGMY